MARQDIAYVAFNRGLVSRLGLARAADIKRVSLSAEIFNNYMPRVLGSMSIRNGRGYLGTTRNNLATRGLPFVFSTSDKARIELTDLTLRVWVADELVTRPAVSSVVTNGTFTANLGSWTDDDDVGATSSWVAPGYMQLVGTGPAAAKRTQQITVGAADLGIEHALRIVIARGPVTLRVGSTAGDDDYITETDLDTGTHSLAFTPTGNFFIRFQSRLLRVVWVDSVAVEGAGTMEVTTPWTAAMLDDIRSAASGDILFCAGYRQYKIERRATHSWSVSEYLAPDGPFRIPNVGPGTMTPSVLSGNGTLTSSLPYFKSTMVGGLFKVTSTGQTVTFSASALNDATDSILVEGVGTDRSFTIVLAGMTAAREVRLQRSFDDLTWVDVSGKTWTTTDTTEAYNDALDNQSIYYRLKVTVAGAGGTTTLTLTIATGSITGICRITAFTTALAVSIEVLTSFGATDPTDDWAEGKWSDYRGYPTSVAFYEGRLGWHGKDTTAQSVSDGYYSFDETIEGDSGPIIRSIGSGPVDTINWALPLQRLILGGQGAEHSCRSTSFDEPLTPTNFNIKKCSRQGSAAVEAVEIDSNGIYVQRGGTRIFELSFSGETYDYISTHLSALIPEIGKPSIVRMAVQRQPDTRVHFVRSDGTVAILIFDKLENVSCFVTLTVDAADGEVEDVVVLPGDDGDDEDHVYYTVKYTINGSTVRYHERWAMQSECLGDGQQCMLADSYVSYSGIPTSIISAPHLAGEQVVIWADGEDIGTNDAGDPIYTLDGSGVANLTTMVSNYVVGLPYMAQWKSGKLGQLQSQVGLALKAHKTIPEIGLILADTHRYGIKFGPDFDNLDDMPSMENGAPVGDNEMYTDYDDASFPFPGTYTVDQRVCLQSQAPRPATALAIVVPVEHHD